MPTGCGCLNSSSLEYRSIQELVRIGNPTNRRIDCFVEEMRAGHQQQRERTEQLQRAVDYWLSKDG